MVVLVSFVDAAGMEPGGSPAPKPRQSWWWLLFGLLTIPIAATYGAYWLLSAQGVSFEVLRTAATVGLDVGGLVTLGALLHRQRLAQQSHTLAQAEHARQLASQAHQIADAERRFEQAERNAAATQADAIQKRAQELFLKAVEHLGHAQAAVRVGALHALDDLGQKHELRRRAVMDVWCAYFRMPPPAITAPKVFTVGAEPMMVTEPGPVWPAEELQVRATAQRLIADHLRDKRSHDDHIAGVPAPATCWGPMDIDLTGAHPHNLDFRGCHVVTAVFERVEFAEDAVFVGAEFTGDTGFFGAEFESLSLVKPEARLRLGFAHVLPEGWRAAPGDGGPGRVLEWDPAFLAAAEAAPEDDET